MRRSWLDVFTDLVDAAPVPRWVVYAAIFAGGAAAVHIAEWADGTLPFPEIAPSVLIGTVFPAVIPWSMQVLDGVAVRALQTLGPALDLDTTRQEALADELTRTPAVASAILGLVGVVAGLMSVLDAPAGWGLRSDSTALAWTAALALSAVTLALLLGFLGHIIHQLRVVDRVHRRSVRVDLFRLAPLYAFATLTSRTGIVLLAITVFGIGAISLTSGGLLALAASDVVTTIVVIAIAIACFIVPLLGLHDRIGVEKDRRLAEANATLETALVEVHRRIAAGEIDAAGKLNDAVAAANAAVLAVSRVSTWPWRPETLRGFLSAVLLPVGLWLLFELLRRLLPG